MQGDIIDSPAPYVSQEQQAALVAVGRQTVQEWKDNQWDPAQAAVLEAAVKEIRALGRRMIADVLKIGEIIDRVVSDTAHGQIAYFYNRIGMEPKTAQNYRNAYTFVQTHPEWNDDRVLDNVQPTALYLLGRGDVAPEIIAEAYTIAVEDETGLRGTDVETARKATRAAKVVTQAEEIAGRVRDNAAFGDITPKDATQALAAVQKIMKPAIPLIRASTNIRANLQATGGFQDFGKMITGPVRPDPKKDPTGADLYDLFRILYGSYYAIVKLGVDLVTPHTGPAPAVVVEVEDTGDANTVLAPVEGV